MDTNGKTQVATKKILVWDLPTRLFHWLLAASFAGAFLTAESERLAVVHVTLGYTMLGLVVFRLLWGIVGTQHARFADFAFGPGRVARYVRSLVCGAHERYVGHNPAGSWAIYAILATVLLAGASGWATYNEVGGHWVEELHEGLANLLMGLVVVHVAGVVVSSLVHHENLVRSMVTGWKSGSPGEAIRSSRPVVGILLLAGVIAYWTGLV